MPTLGHDPRVQAHHATEREPGNAHAWIMLAEYELDAGNASAGEAAALRAIALRPRHPEALARLGRAQWMQGRCDAAVASLKIAAEEAPAHPGIAVWLGNALEAAGDPEAAADCYARAHALAPDEPQLAAYLLACRRRLCDWRELDMLAAQVRGAIHSGRAAAEPFAFLSEDSTAAEQLQCARIRARSIAGAIQPLARDIATGPPLRLGFLSNGFGAHPTGLLSVAFFEHLRDVAGVETHLFALNPDDSSLTRQRLQRATHALHDVSALAHAVIAQKIRMTAVDVLFDLRGWGGGGVPEVLAMRPAPLQVNWLAYPGTSGAPWIDYILADRVVLPPQLAPQFSEAVAWLPRCFQPSDTRREVPEAPSRADCGLPATGVVFCCFSNSYKLNPTSVRRALAILQGVPGSVLWLLSGPGRADERLRTAAQRAGVEASRLIFMPKQPHPEYLARLRVADLFLDTNPYNAHTTASDALWAGCPVLTRPGATFAARVAASLNHHAGMDMMNVDSDDSFVAQAIRLGTNTGALARLREQLALRRHESALFDMAGFASDFVAISRRMADRHCAGLPPEPFG
jgi:predicted O-linked N-acetylglucosamine transferase (SPINDLY family)